MRNGTEAARLFNFGLETTPLPVSWAQSGRTGSRPVQALWQRKIPCRTAGGVLLTVPAQGAALVKASRPNRDGQSRFAVGLRPAGVRDKRIKNKEKTP